MSESSGKWGDLGARIASAVAILLVSAGAIWMGGWYFVALAMVAGTLMSWESARMAKAGSPITVAAFSALILLLAMTVSGQYSLYLLLAGAAVTTGMTKENKVLFGLSQVVILVGAFSFVVHFQQNGLSTLVWLIAVVVVTDIAGYFAGRLLGGPKFWPAISPKKTWSGTVAGWVGAGIVGFVATGPDQQVLVIVLISMLLSFASQMGDIFQSWIKRRAGVKDSSALIPGHGGVWDRFDGMLGASLALWVVSGLTLGGI
jgi:phosphatidate cytidylyltransferase